MNRTASALALFAAFYAAHASAEDAAAPPQSPLTANVALASEYLYRGIAQGNQKPALQGGVDYAHPNGFYVGTWASTITWLKDANAAVKAPLEIDVYGGYKNSFATDWSYDLGVLTYNYPGSYPAGYAPKPDTTELYAQLGYKWLTAKYSYVVSDHIFGFTSMTGGKTDGSGYFDVTATVDLGDGWGVTGHGGHQTIKGNGPASYSDYKLGVTKDVGFGTVAAYLSGTDAKHGIGDPYRSPVSTRNMGASRLVLSFTKTLDL